MQVGIGQNYAIVAGTATKDAEFKTIGDKNTPLASFSLAVNGKGEGGIYVNCKAFGRQLAGYARGIKKGDSVCAIGVIEIREYNGKTYKDLNCQWLNYIGEGGVVLSSFTSPSESLAQPNYITEPESVEEDDCPF